MAFGQTSAILSSELQIPKAGKSEAFHLCKTCHAEIFSLLQMMLHMNLEHRASHNQTDSPALHTEISSSSADAPGPLFIPNCAPSQGIWDLHSIQNPNMRSQGEKREENEYRPGDERTLRAQTTNQQQQRATYYLLSD